MRHLGSLRLGCSLITTLVACGTVDYEPAALQEALTDGQPYTGHPSVGWLSIGSGDYCTATLVGKRTVLTVAHCIQTIDYQFVNLQGLCYGARTDKVQIHPSYDPVSHDNDLALIVLDLDPPITPSVVSKTAPSPGLKVTLVGYGSTADTAQDWGIKRIARNTIKEVASTTFTIEGTGGGLGNTCYGDSGGPAFATYGNKEVQVGISLGGTHPCGTKGVATRVDAFLAWLTTASGGDLFEGATGSTSAALIGGCAVSACRDLAGGLLLAFVLVCLGGIGLRITSRSLRSSRWDTRRWRT